MKKIERSWDIIEEHPIKVNVEKSWTGKHYTIKVPPMKMRHETAMDLGDNLSLSAIEHGEKNGLSYDHRIKTLANDVTLFQYDYETGEVCFIASTFKDFENWLKYYEDRVCL